MTTKERIQTKEHVPRGRPEDATVTRRILAATLELVAQNGYSGLRIEHVAKRAGCGRPAIYRRYGNKADLVATAALSVLDLGENPDTGNLVDDLVEHALVNQKNQMHPGLKHSPGPGLLAMFEPEVFALLWERFFSLRHEQGMAIIARGAARGEVDRDVDADVLLDTIAGLTLYRSTIKQAEVSAAHYRDVIVALVAKPPLRQPGAIPDADRTGRER